MIGTLLKTNLAPLNMVVWIDTTFPFGLRPIFSVFFLLLVSGLKSVSLGSNQGPTHHGYPKARSVFVPPGLPGGKFSFSLISGCCYKGVGDDSLIEKRSNSLGICRGQLESLTIRGEARQKPIPGSHTNPDCYITKFLCHHISIL